MAKSLGPLLNAINFSPNFHLSFSSFAENPRSWYILQNIPDTYASYNKKNGKKLWTLLHLGTLWRLLTTIFKFNLKFILKRFTRAVNPTNSNSS